MKVPRYFSIYCPKWAVKLEKMDEKDPETWEKLQDEILEDLFLGHEYNDIMAEAWRDKNTGDWHFARNVTDSLDDPQCLECGQFSQQIWDIIHEEKAIYNKFYRLLARFTTHMKKGNHTMLPKDEWYDKIFFL